MDNYCGAGERIEVIGCSPICLVLLLVFPLFDGRERAVICPVEGRTATVSVKRKCF